MSLLESARAQRLVDNEYLADQVASFDDAEQLATISRLLAYGGCLSCSKNHAPATDSCTKQTSKTSESCTQQLKTQYDRMIHSPWKHP